MPPRNQVATMALSMMNGADHWRGRAEEMRTLAEDMRAAEPKTIMLRMAVDYDRLAEWAEKQSAGDLHRLGLAENFRH